MTLNKHAHLQYITVEVEVRMTVNIKIKYRK